MASALTKALFDRLSSSGLTMRAQVLKDQLQEGKEDTTATPATGPTSTRPSTRASSAAPPPSDARSSSDALALDSSGGGPGGDEEPEWMNKEKNTARWDKIIAACGDRADLLVDVDNEVMAAVFLVFGVKIMKFGVFFFFTVPDVSHDLYF